MPKQIPRNEEIYLAPGILGRYENNEPVAIDERNGNKILDPNNVDHKIIIYEREVQEWFLSPATMLLDENSFNNSFIVLMVCMSYIEGVEQYKTGVDSNRRSKDCFVDSLQRLYPDKFLERDIKKLYTKSRCGLFHNGMVKGGVAFSSMYVDVIEFRDGGETIRINPRLLLDDIKADFTAYIRELRTVEISEDNSRSEVLRTNFDRMFSVL